MQSIPAATKVRPDVLRPSRALPTAAALILTLAAVTGCASSAPNTAPFDRDDIATLQTSFSESEWRTVDPGEMRDLFKDWGAGTDPTDCQALTLSGNGPVLGEEVEKFNDFTVRGGTLGDGSRWTTMRVFPSPEIAAGFLSSMSTAFEECLKWKRGDGLLFLAGTPSSSVVDGWDIISRASNAGVSLETFDSGVMSEPKVEYYMIRDNLLVGGELEFGVDPAQFVPALNEALTSEGN